MTPTDPPSYPPRRRRPDRPRQRRSGESPTADARPTEQQPAPADRTPDEAPLRRPGGSPARRATAAHARAPQGGSPARRSLRPQGSRDTGPARTEVAGTGTRLLPRDDSTISAREDAAPPVYAPRQAPPGRPPAPAAARPTRDRAAAPPPRPDATGRAPRGSRPARPRRRRVPRVLVFLLVLLVAWPVGLGLWANARIGHTDELPRTVSTPGTTYLLAGSDSRADGSVADATPGQRSDTIMLLHVPSSGPTALISLPRDTYVEIPGHGPGKLNAAYSIGGPQLLASTVEDLTGIGVDHYVEVGMGGVTSVVDAVGGVELCMDMDVTDEFSGLRWTAGCHRADGTTALQFARMRYSDPRGDIGRAERQRQVVAQVTDAVTTPRTVVDPIRQVRLVRAGTDALLTDPDSGVVDLARMALAFRRATGPGGVVGTPPISSTGYSRGGIGATVLLDEAQAPQFFDDMLAGRLTPTPSAG